MQYMSSSVAKRKMRIKVEIYFYQAICVPILTYGHKLSLVDETMRLWIQVAYISLEEWLGSPLEIA